MKVDIQPGLSDFHLDAQQTSSQRQLAIALSSLETGFHRQLPINLCLILDHSGSMNGRPLETVKQAAQQLVERLAVGDRISIIAFDHKAKVLVPNQMINNPVSIKSQINQLKAAGGTCIDEGMRLGIEELAKGKRDTISHAFLLTDGENEHGDNDRCVKLAEVAAGYNLTLNTLGFGDHWNQDVLERIADKAGGSLSYIQEPEAAVAAFSSLLRRVQAVGLTNAYLQISLSAGVRLAELKPIAQVAPDTIELPYQIENHWIRVRLGDLMMQVPRVVLANLYISQLPLGRQVIARIQVQYEDPALGVDKQWSETIPVEVEVMHPYQAQPNFEVQRYVLALAKYRQTQIAETRLQKGDRAGAATMLQTAAQTALQMGDTGAATVLQTSATRLQEGEDLSESERKRTRIVSKTILQ